MADIAKRTLISLLLLLLSAGVQAQEKGADQYSDRVGAQRMVQELEKLPTGRDRDFYRDALEKKGFTITEIDIDTPQLWEVEAVKNNKSFVLTVQFDPESEQSTALLAGRQRWASDPTELYLPYGISDRTALGVPPTHEEWAFGKAALQRTLRPGNEKQWYRNRLDAMGYEITSVNYDRSDYVEYEVVKDRLTYEIQLDFVGEQATDVEIDSNWWRTTETEAALISARLKSSKNM